MHAYTLSLVERVLGHFMWGPGPMSVTINRQKKIILLLKFACDTVKTDLRLKKILALSTKDNFELQNQTKVQIMLAVLFFKK